MQKKQHFILTCSTNQIKLQPQDVVSYFIDCSIVSGEVCRQRGLRLRIFEIRTGLTYLKLPFALDAQLISEKLSQGIPTLQYFEVRKTDGFSRSMSNFPISNVFATVNCAAVNAGFMGFARDCCGPRALGAARLWAGLKV